MCAAGEGFVGVDGEEGQRGGIAEGESVRARNSWKF